MPLFSPPKLWNRLEPSLLGWLVLTLLCCAAAPGVASTGPAGKGRQPAAVAMFLWRGLTDSELGFMETLRAAGDFEPTFTILNAQADPKRLQQLVQASKTQHYDLIYGFGTTVAMALKAEIKDTPIVFNIVARPLESGLIASWAHSGNNLTGISNEVPMASAFRVLRMMVPFRKLGFIYNPLESNARIQMEEVKNQQRRFGFRLLPIPLPNAGALDASLQSLLTNGADAVLLPSDSMVLIHGQAIVHFLNTYGIPTIASIPEVVKESGAFVALGPDYRDLGRLAGQNALAVLRGARPAEVPSRKGSQQTLTVNMKTAKRLGLSLPLQLLKISDLVP